MSEITDEYMQETLSKSKDYTVALLRLTDKGRDPGVRQIIWEHGRRNLALRDDGKMPIICRAADDSDWAGIGIFTGSPEEVQELMQGDPGVEAGLFTYELHPVRSFPGASLP